MKKIFLSMATALALALVVANRPAQATETLQTVTPDWHYRWHEGRWWYWMPESSSWMVWIGSTWVSYGRLATCPNVFPVSQAVPYTAGYGSYDETENRSAIPDPAYWRVDQPAYSAGSGTDYSAYGWGWGPGTAFRDGPGRRF